MIKAIYKFNNGNGALLCNNCRTIIKTGAEFSVNDELNMKSGLPAPPQLCKNCTVMNFKEELITNPKIAKLMEFIEQDKSEAFVVGGWVRDLILDVESDDIDIVVHGDGIAFAFRFAKFIGMKDKVVVFERFGTAKITSKEWDLDFVGARKESYDSASRNPKVQNGTIMDDLSRRDLTINAMSIALHPSELGNLLDPFNGLLDLHHGIIKTPIEPDVTFKDDPLRMLRAVRFAARFTFEIEPKTLQGINDNVERLSIISDERINVELEKTLKTKDPQWGFMLLNDTGLLQHVLPEVTALKGQETKNGVSHKNNFLHTLEVVQNVRKLTDNIELLWTALLHDIGKAKVKKFEDNSWKFHNHELVSERMLNRIATTLKWSIDQTKLVKKLTRFHGDPKELCKDIVSDSAIRRFILNTEDIFGPLMLFCSCDITTTNDGKKKRQQDALGRLAERANSIKERDNLSNWKNPLKGDWLIANGMKPGPKMGKLLATVKEAILDGDISNDKEAAQAFATSFLIAQNFK